MKPFGEIATRLIMNFEFPPIFPALDFLVWKIKVGEIQNIFCCSLPCFSIYPVVEGGGTSMRSSIIDENREVDLNDDSPKITPDAGPKMTSSTPPIGMKSLNCYV